MQIRHKISQIQQIIILVQQLIAPQLINLSQLLETTEIYQQLRISIAVKATVRVYSLGSSQS